MLSSTRFEAAGRNTRFVKWPLAPSSPSRLALILVRMSETSPFEGGVPPPPQGEDQTILIVRCEGVLQHLASSS
jgi:hypothetical protein